MSVKKIARVLYFIQVNVVDSVLFGVAFVLAVFGVIYEIKVDKKIFSAERSKDCVKEN